MGRGSSGRGSVNDSATRESILTAMNGLREGMSRARGTLRRADRDAFVASVNDLLSKSPTGTIISDEASEGTIQFVKTGRNSWRETQVRRPDAPLGGQTITRNQTDEGIMHYLLGRAATDGGLDALRVRR